MSSLARLHQITSDQHLSFHEKVHRLMRFGLDEFALDIAIVSRIDGKDYIVEHVITPDDSLAVGTHFNLGETYCTHTLHAKSALAFEHAGNSDIATHPCYINFQLESYIGAPIEVAGRVYGTINFSSPNIHHQAFTREQLDYVTLLGQWIGIEISRYRDFHSLHLQHQSLKAMSELAKIGAWEVDLQRDKLYWSKQTKVIHGVADDFQPSLSDALSFYDSLEREKIEGFINRAIAEHQPWSCEVALTARDGQQKWVAIKGKPECEQGQCVRINGAIQDITDIVNTRQALAQQREQAEHLLNTRSAFLAKISHELRTPINGINGMLLALQGEEDLDVISQRVELALSGSETLVRLVNDVLDYSKIDAGQMQLDEQDLNVSLMLNDVISIYQPLCAQKGIVLKHYFEVDNNVWVKADGTRIKQILVNLLSNALKFTAKGCITLNVVLRKAERCYELQARVIDTGVGMDKQVLDALFTPFTQGGSHIAREYGGTGLGLSIVYELCKLMGGRVGVSSKVGQGSVFTFSVNLAPGQPIKAQLKNVPNTQGINKNLRILVVDDNHMNRVVMKALLEKLGLEAEYAEHGQQAVEVLRDSRGNFDIVFMDCVMPILDGFGATEKIRSLKSIRQPHIIALTANTSELDKKRCLEAGMNSFIAKPVGFSQLSEVLRGR
ncbi:Autoinducer 2 sensor kinase/phosphatase LuxQ (plasmid) [Pseudoalteromonas sp. THAF3]|uniref:GAF domain-containing hybrid sensor histidine kinase/response regulator n=1 Tax=Pseudoalteromonas sp. THAF3 TaxID=2587843 RepID=UPI0012688044|nr:GAF domain-containing hybrid sensor histidine kinase/response regulator [Pseudoalteromonas sp. THAF3]QFU06368.1 Autoinducer 2 sensor kinase/phosphatase LuxQ [Pseudoalteromonas sp. THAF3]